MNNPTRADFNVSCDPHVYTYRWLKGSGVLHASEGKQRQLANDLIGDNVDVEVAPFSFVTASKSEEIRGAPHVFNPNLPKNNTLNE